MITAPEARVLAAIKLQPLTDGQIANVTGLGRPTVKRVLRELESQGRAAVVGNLQVLSLSKPQWGARA